MTWDERLTLIRGIIGRARATGNTEALAKATGLLSEVLALKAEADMPQDAPDPMTRAHAREDDRQAGGLHQLRKGRAECTATRRDGEPCRAPAIDGGLVCRHHGGAALQVRIAATRTLLLTASYDAHREWQAARGTAAEFDALCAALQAQRDLGTFEAKVSQLAGLRAKARTVRTT
jgi:hypothetical protein